MAASNYPANWTQLERELGYQGGTLADTIQNPDRKRIGDWLSPADQTKFHIDKVTEDPLGAAANLLGKQSRVARWTTNGNRLLRISGNSGTGKSVLVANIVVKTFDEVIKLNRNHRALLEPRNMLGYFFCSTRENEFFDFSTFARTIISQFCPFAVPHQRVKQLYRRCCQQWPGRQPEIAQLMTCLKTILQDFFADDENGKVYLIIDGLDRVPVKEQVPYNRFLRDVMQEDYKNLHILLSCKDSYTTKHYFETSDQWKTVNMDRSDFTKRSHKAFPDYMFSKVPALSR
ncbi:hypothetical protein HYALB_00012092 [Hymenoscyphus albidus]|uniref:Nephrocystin 3-like N-terminal domain-containing protein n=1 Tax=Hymenoscyphus albidus TaxID=595503 RepID=A0A9N9Q4L4_9HELO|nr:hypothetical protein HYALB_00012092 [Hymenoscyphus albidus]